ncbi:MAG TPA: ABC transporter substrate-binding protein, partial [Burkholderiales bacterium]
MMKLPLSLAIGPYDHTRDLRPDGIVLTRLDLPIEEIFFRFTKFREWDVSEMSFGKVISLMAEERPEIIAIPVFVSRVFRHSAIYVANSKIKAPKDLEGKRVGIPEWAQTAGIYVRGLLQHEYGVDLASIDWRQAGVREPGRVEKIELRLPPGVRVQPMPEHTLA